MRKIIIGMFAAVLTFCSVMSVQAQVMKSEDLEKYAKQKYGDKWVDAAMNIAGGLELS